LLEHVRRFIKNPREFIHCLLTGGNLELEFEPKNLRVELAKNLLRDKQIQDASSTKEAASLENIIGKHL
jgi:hypothetical protein